MFEAVGKKGDIYLKRISMGPLVLSDDLKSRRIQKTLQ